jgi:hypothetical protein
MKTDIPLEDPRMQGYVKTVLDSVVAVKEVLERSDRSLLLVAVTQRDPLAVLGEADCKSVFLRQYTEHTVMGRA